MNPITILTIIGLIIFFGMNSDDFRTIAMNLIKNPFVKFIILGIIICGAVQNPKTALLTIVLFVIGMNLAGIEDIPQNIRQLIGLDNNARFN